MYNKNELKKEILENNGGTYNEELKNANLKSGFMVSIQGYEFVTLDIIDAINKMVEYTEIVKNKKGYYVGVWVDTNDNGRIYVDISKNVSNKRDAEKTARQNKQIAIYDIRHGKSIYLNYDIVYYSVYKNIKNELGDIIDQVFIKGFDTLHEIGKLYRIDKENYFILKDYININDL